MKNKMLPAGRVLSNIPQWQEHISSFKNTKSIVESINAYEDALKEELEAVRRYKMSLVMSLLEAENG